MADVFLSYAKEDRTRAKAVAALLESCGWSVFWDVKIKEGSDWRKGLERELGKARVLLVLWSESSGASDWVKEEAEIGRQRNILVSVLIDKVTPPLGFGTLQAIDLIGWRGGRAEGVDRLVRAVSKALLRAPGRGWRPPPSPTRRRLVFAAGAVCLMALAAYPIAQRLRKAAPIMNQEIVIDASEGMGSPFDQGKTKLQAAIEALNKRSLHSLENLALRAFGGECNQPPGSELLVSFGTDRGPQILRAANGIQPHGKATLVSGVVSALGDFRPLPNSRRLVVITGHADRCHDEGVREIRKWIEAYERDGLKIDFEVRFIGLGVSEQDQTQLKAASDSLGGQAYFVDTTAQLNEALEYVLEFEPAMGHVKTVWGIMDEVARALSEIATNMNQRKFDEATRILDAARESYVRMTPSFDALAGKQLTVDFEKFYKLAAESRLLQEQAFEFGGEAIRQGRASGENQTPAYQEAIKKWNDAVQHYNKNIGEMNRLSQEIATRAQRRGLINE